MSSDIISDERVFDESNIPKSIIGRDKHVKEIEKCLVPAKTGSSINNLYIYGPPGTGKTTAVKHVLNKHFGENYVYINCWSNRTTHKVMEELLQQLGFVIHGHESTTTLIKKFDRPTKKKNIIICLDEVDQLKDNKGILYVLARNSCGLVLISNLPYSSMNMDQRIKSRLFINDLEFKPYEREEVFSILKDRASDGLHPDSINDQILSEISEICSGDARIGLNILRAAAMEAQSNKTDSITSEMIKLVGKSSQKYRLSYLKGKLNEHQKVIYEILMEKKKIDSGKLYKAYVMSVNNPVTSRGYRKYMKRMTELGLVKEIGTKRWKRFEII